MSTQMIGAEKVAKALNTSKGYAYKVMQAQRGDGGEGHAGGQGQGQR